MKSRPRYKLCWLVWIVLYLFSLTAPGAWAQAPVSLYEAVATNRVEATIRGRSSTFIQPMVVLEAKSLTGEPLLIEIPRGATLENEGGSYCDLVILNVDPAPVYIEATGPAAAYRLYAYCLQPAPFPTAEAVYRPLEGVASEPVLTVLQNIEQDNQGRESFAAQLAVWSAATGKDLSQLQQELEADYSLYQASVAGYLGLETPAPAPAPATEEAVVETGPTPATSADALDQESGSETASGLLADPTYFLLAVAGVVLLGTGVLVLVAFRRSPSPSEPQNSRAGAGQNRNRRDPNRDVPPARVCPGCRQKLDAGGNCTNPECSLNKRGDRISIVSKPEETAPIPVDPPSPAMDRPDYKHAPTELIGIIDHPPTEPISSPEDFDAKDRLKLKVIKGEQAGQEYVLPGLQGVISRGRAGQIPIPGDKNISTPHAALAIYHPTGGQDRIRDLGSKNGLYKNDDRLEPHQWADLNDGDILRFGVTRMRYEQGKRQLVDVGASASPVLLHGNNRWLITRQEIPFIDFASNDVSISVPHVYIRANNHLEVRDLSSGNGVYVQGRKIDGRELIFNEEIIRFGRETEIQIITDIDIPQEIGEWERRRLVGGGGMADVYRVRHKTSGDIRALKIPRPSKYRRRDNLGQTYRQLFKNETDLAGKIHHENLVEAHDWGEMADSGLPYLVMDYVDGPSVETIIDKLDEIPVADVAEIAVQVGRALEALHTQIHYAHCDVKPNNIIIEYGGDVYLTDLGVATVIGEEFSGLGVSQYLPGEVLEKGPVGVDTDIYSLGRTMFEMLARQSPSTKEISENRRESAEEVIPSTNPIDISTELPATRLKHIAGLSAAHRNLTRIILKCIDKKRENRYQQMSDLLEDLAPLRSGADLKQLAAKTGWRPATP